jgi:hypothetical protein
LSQSGCAERQPIAGGADGGGRDGHLRHGEHVQVVDDRIILRIIALVQVVQPEHAARESNHQQLAGLVEGNGPNVRLFLREKMLLRDRPAAVR